MMATTHYPFSSALMASLAISACSNMSASPGSQELSSQASENSSFYTKLTDCETIAEDIEYSLVNCGTFEYFDVNVETSDGREAVLIKPSPGEGYRLEISKITHGAFNHLGSQLEWRISSAGSEPVALIHRVFTWVPTEDGLGRYIQHLAVHKLSENTQGTCLVGSVNTAAVPSANRVARILADKHAPDFNCARDQALLDFIPTPEL